MELDNQPNSRRIIPRWILCLVILGLIVIAVVVYNASGIRYRRSGASRSQIDAVSQGNINIKYIIANVNKEKRVEYAWNAVSSYSNDGPSPAVYRRIGIVKQEYLGKSGLNDFQKINSSIAVKGLSKSEISGLSGEIRMWQDIYGHDNISKKTAKSYVSRISNLDLGPLKDVAILRVYLKSHDIRQADSVRSRIEYSARIWFFAVFSFALIFFAAVVVGVVLAVKFLSRQREVFRRGKLLNMETSIFFVSFLVYLIGYYFIGLLLFFCFKLFGIDIRTDANTIFYLILNIIAILCAYALGLMVYKKISPGSVDCMRQIGYKKLPFSEAVKWGVGGYCVLVPIMAVCVKLSDLIFRNFNTPENPITDVASNGGMAFFLSLIISAVLAPVVEETAFRGMFYTGLRTKMGVLEAALVSGAVFSIIHPTLPGGFLPILALGTVFAIVREKTGSLLPGMIAHGINNALICIIIYLFY